MGMNADREFLVFDSTVATLRALSYSHSDGIKYASTGLITAKRALLQYNEEVTLENTVQTLERLYTLNMLQSIADAGDLRRWRLTDGIVTVMHTGKRSCNRCENEAIADAYGVTSRIWGWFCGFHFVYERCWLGTGRGQILRNFDFPSRPITYQS